MENIQPVSWSAVEIFCGIFKAAGMYFATVTIVKRQKKHFIQQLSFRIDNVHLHLHALN